MSRYYSKPCVIADLNTRQVFSDKLLVPDEPGPSNDDPFGGDPDAAPDSRAVNDGTDTED